MPAPTPTSETGPRTTTTGCGRPPSQRWVYGPLSTGVSFGSLRPCKVLYKNSFIVHTMDFVVVWSQVNTWYEPPRWLLRCRRKFSLVSRRVRNPSYPQRPWTWTEVGQLGVSSGEEGRSRRRGHGNHFRTSPDTVGWVVVTQTGKYLSFWG